MQAMDEERRVKAWVAGIVVGLSLATGAGASSTGEALVTAEEAARPDAPVRVSRGLFPGPAIKLMLPSQATLERPLASPFRLKFEFTPRNDAKVDLSSVKMTYLKSPAADLTPRILASITVGGIDLLRVTLPPGHHSFTVSVLDSHGNRGLATYTFTVAK
jgi:hypothetical protein